MRKVIAYLLGVVMTLAVVTAGLAYAGTRYEDQQTFTKATISEANAGTCGTNVTCTEYGDGYHHITVMSLSGVAYTIGDNAALADGALIYTFPAGEVVVRSCSFDVSLSLTTGTPTTDTPDVGLGTVIASGAVATLDGTATFENIVTGQTFNDMAGTNEKVTLIGPTADNAGFVIGDAAAHTLHLNIADTWADVTNTAATADGTITCEWVWFGNPA